MTSFLPFPCTKLRHLIGFTKKNAPFYVSFCHVFVIILMFVNAFFAFCKTHVASATSKRDTLQGAVLRVCLPALYAANSGSLGQRRAAGFRNPPGLGSQTGGLRCVNAPVTERKRAVCYGRGLVCGIFDAGVSVAYLSPCSADAAHGVTEMRPLRGQKRQKAGRETRLCMRP